MNTIAQHRGIWRRWSICLVGLACLARADDGTQQFFWKDGTSLRGRITSATADELTFVTPTFSQPVMLDQAALAEVRFETDVKAEAESFIVSMVDGTMVTGDLLEISNNRMVVLNRVLGEFSIPVDEVMSVRRVAGSETLPLPGGWSPKLPAGGKPTPQSKAATTAVEGEMRRISLPERCDLVFKMRTVPQPSFRVIVTGAGGQKVTMEANNGDLILQGRLFYLIKNLEAVNGEVKLHLYWNQRTGRAVLCKPGGASLGDTTKGPVGEVPGGDTQGVLLQRVSSTDVIEYLGVSTWDEALPTTLVTEGPRVLLTDETSVPGRVARVSGGVAQVVAADGTTKSVPLGKVFLIRFATQPPPAKAKPVTLLFADGTQVDGTLTGIRACVGTLQTRLMSHPMAFKLAGLRQMVFQSGANDAPSPTEALQTLTCGEVLLHGAVENGEGGVHWRVTGGKTGVPIAPGVAYSISRKVEAAEADSAVFHLANGEVWSGKLTGMNRKEVEASWDFGAPFKVAAEEVRAIQFAADRVNIKGFKEDEWEPTTGKDSAVSLSEREVTLSGQSTLTHLDAMRAGEINFQWQPTGSYCNLQMRLFCSEAALLSSGIPVRLTCNSGRLQIWLSDGNGLNRSRELGGAAVLSGPVAIRMRIEDDEVGIWVNDSPRFVIPAEAKFRAGNGLRFEVNLLSNRLVIGGIVNGRAIIQRSNSAPIRIWDFVASTTTAQLRPAGGVPATTRLEALRIPRFRQDAQPLHVLVAANRDLLRGEIESVAGEHVQFRSGLETLRVPLDRLAAIVSPLSVAKETVATSDARPATKAEQSAEKDAAKAGALTFVMLNSGGRVGLKFEAIRDDVLRGRHPIIGECRIPMSKVSSIDTHESSGLVAARSLDAWRWELAPEPVLPETGGESSQLLGKEAAVFKLPLLGGGDFDLANEKGKVVVLDFWATWCGPCIKSLPGLIDALSAFSPEQVKLIGVNQGEGGEVVKRFLEARNLKMIVAMDGSQSVARQYGVEGIPHTVIIGPDGKVEWVKTDYSPEGAKEAAAAISKLLKKQ